MRVGIDLGTTYCVVARVDENTGRPAVIKNTFGEPVTPSTLYFEENGNVVIGQEAKDYYEDGDPETEAYFKYKMGDPDFITEHYGKTYNAEELSALLLEGLIRDAEASCGEKITEAVITVPAYFEHPKRVATRRAGEKAGLKVLGIINEPTAAVFAYGINGKNVDKTVMIYDLGGGTFDITIARVSEKDITVLGSDGDHELGGRNFDDVIVEYIADLFYDEHDIILGDDLNFNNTLRVQAEKAKKALTNRQSEKITVSYKGHKGVYELTDKKFAEISAHLVERTENIIDRLFDELSMSWSSIDGVILVGGSTRMKMVRDFVERMSGKPPYSGIDPDQAVAVGAAIRANIDENGNPVGERRFFLGEGKKKPRFMIAGARSFHEATAHSLGMISESPDGQRYINSIMIRKNSPVPAAITQPYALRVSRKEEENLLKVYMLQGENEELEYPLNATCLGKYVFSGIRYTGETEETIDVSYKYSAESVVTVEAVQRSTKSPLKLSVEPVEEDMSWVTECPLDRVAETKDLRRMDIVMAIDLSGSMSGRPLEETRKAVQAFLDEFDFSVTRVGLLGFSEHNRIFATVTDRKQELTSAVYSMSCNREMGYGTSAIPFKDAMDMLDDRDAVRYVVVLTDGVWQNPRKARVQVQKLWRAGIETIALGFGSVDRYFLRSIASREEFAKLTDLGGLTKAFTGIARKL